MAEETKKTMGGERAGRGEDKAAAPKEEDVGIKIIEDLDKLEEKIEGLDPRPIAVGEMTVISIADAVYGFAAYLTGVKTFRAGSRGDSGKMLKFASDFCVENEFGEPSDEYPGNVRFPKS